MAISGKYIYGIIKTQQDERFGPIGLQGEEVLTVGMGDLAMLVSTYESETEKKVRSSRKNLIAHQKVLEAIMEHHTVLPVKFGTLAAHEGEVRNLLMKHEVGFLKNLQMLDNRIELSVKVFWQDMRSIYDEILAENEAIKSLKINMGTHANTNDLIQVGKMVESALEMKKEEEATAIFQELASVSVQSKSHKLSGDQMIMNAAFLISKGREKEFDNLLNDLAAPLSDRLKFKYVGPLAPYSFVDLNIYPETWEV